mmetsp:Transcript_13284/g.37901  ORF Transcript_13284/g.37901 Transcript_13284/m.37901 type:complete len:313 (-) Transcript_13284:708-1646(-)
MASCFRTASSSMAKRSSVGELRPFFSRFFCASRASPMLISDPESWLLIWMSFGMSTPLALRDFSSCRRRLRSAALRSFSDMAAPSSLSLSALSLFLPSVPIHSFDHASIVLASPLGLATNAAMLSDWVLLSNKSISTVKFPSESVARAPASAPAPLSASALGDDDGDEELIVLAVCSALFRFALLALARSISSCSANLSVRPTSPLILSALSATLRSVASFCFWICSMMRICSFTMASSGLIALMASASTWSTGSASAESVGRSCPVSFTDDRTRSLLACRPRAMPRRELDCRPSPPPGPKGLFTSTPTPRS